MSVSDEALQTARRASSTQTQERSKVPLTAVRCTSFEVKDKDVPRGEDCVSDAATNKAVVCCSRDISAACAPLHVSSIHPRPHHVDDADSKGGCSFSLRILYPGAVSVYICFTENEGRLDSSSKEPTIKEDRRSPKPLFCIHYARRVGSDINT